MTKAQQGVYARTQVKNPHRCGTKSFTTRRKEIVSCEKLDLVAEVMMSNKQVIVKCVYTGG